MKKIRCALYDRVSTDEQVEHGLSLDTQKDALTEYALSHGYEIVGYYTDEGITARKKMENRKELLRLLKDVKADKIDLILVTKLDRWFRNIKDYHNTQAILEAHHCNWKTIFEEYDTSTSNGRFAINIMLSVNENECDRCSERIKSVFEYKKKNKELLNGPSGFGYITVNKKLEKDPETRHIVDDIFAHYFSCFSKRDTIQYTLETYGDEAPTEYQIERILSSKRYMGELYGIPDYCEPYITHEQYEIIQSVSDSKTYPFTNGVYIFSQLIKCPVCGCSLTGFVKKQKLKDGSYSLYKRYRCYNKYKFKHSSVCITESKVEEYMLRNVVQVLQARILELKAAQKAAPKDNTQKYQAELDRLNFMYQKGRISEQYYEEQYAATSNKLREEQLLRKTTSLIALESIRQHFSGEWQELYQQLDLEHKRGFWKRFIKAIYVDEETHKLCGFDFLI